MDRLIGFVAYITFTFMMVLIVVVVGSVVSPITTCFLAAAMLYIQGLILYSYFFE